MKKLHKGNYVQLKFFTCLQHPPSQRRTINVYDLSKPFGSIQTDPSSLDHINHQTLCTNHLLSSSDARWVLNSRDKFHIFGRCQCSSWPKIRNFVKINGSLLLFWAYILLHYPNPYVSSLPRILQQAQLCIQVSDFHSASWYIEYITEFTFLGPRDIAVANFRLPYFWNSSIKRKTFPWVASKLHPVPPLQAPQMGWRTSETPQQLRVSLATAAEGRAEHKQQTSRTMVFPGKPPALLAIFPMIHWHEGPRWKLIFNKIQQKPLFRLNTMCLYSFQWKARHVNKLIYCPSHCT